MNFFMNLDPQKISYKIIVMFVICLVGVALMLPSVASARPPQPVFYKKGKVDNSGKPVFNSWQQIENERKQRNKLKKKGAAGTQNNTPPQSTTATSPSNIPGDTIKNSAGSAPTPSSVIINRPVQIQAEPDKQDFNF